MIVGNATEIRTIHLPNVKHNPTIYDIQYHVGITAINIIYLYPQLMSATGLKLPCTAHSFIVVPQVSCRMSHSHTHTCNTREEGQMALALPPLHFQTRRFFEFSRHKQQEADVALLASNRQCRRSGELCSA
jgi:hypothetical protein